MTVTEARKLVDGAPLQPHITSAANDYMGAHSGDLLALVAGWLGVGPRVCSNAALAQACSANVTNAFCDLRVVRADCARFVGGDEGTQFDGVDSAVRACVALTRVLSCDYQQCHGYASPIKSRLIMRV